MCLKCWVKLKNFRAVWTVSMRVLIVLLYCAAVCGPAIVAGLWSTTGSPGTELIKIDRTCARTPMASNEYRIHQPTGRKRTALTYCRHAHNPVDWLPPGCGMRLKKARAQGETHFFCPLGYQPAMVPLWWSESHSRTLEIRLDSKR